LAAAVAVVAQAVPALEAAKGQNSRNNLLLAPEQKKALAVPHPMDGEACKAHWN